MNDMRAMARKANWSGEVEILVMEKRERGFAYAEQVVMYYDPDNPGRIIEPTFKLSYDAAQQLMDDLWQAGLRPSEGSGSAGALAATQKHLEDMRKLVFKDA